MYVSSYKCGIAQVPNNSNGWKETQADLLLSMRARTGKRGASFDIVGASATGSGRAASIVNFREAVTPGRTRMRSPRSGTSSGANAAAQPTDKSRAGKESDVWTSTWGRSYLHWVWAHPRMRTLDRSWFLGGALEGKAGAWQFDAWVGPCVGVRWRRRAPGICGLCPCGVAFVGDVHVPGQVGVRTWRKEPTVAGSAEATAAHRLYS